MIDTNMKKITRDVTRTRDEIQVYSFDLDLEVSYHPSQLPIRAFMPWQLVIDSTDFNVLLIALFYRATL